MSKVLYGLAFLLGVVGNSLVIFVILRYSKMQTVTNLYILSLAVADECFLIGIPFLMTTMALKFWPFGNVMCKVTILRIYSSSPRGIKSNNYGSVAYSNLWRWTPFIKVYMTTTSVNQFTSSLLLTVMSADRYIAVCHPITSPTFRTPLIAKVWFQNHTQVFYF